MSPLQRDIPNVRIHKYNRPGTWLAGANPPSGQVLAGERKLWWAVVRQAARDLLSSRSYLAGDALEFLAITGAWLCRELFGIDEDETRAEVVKLLRWRLANNPTQDLKLMCAGGIFPSDPTATAKS